MICKSIIKAGPLPVLLLALLLSLPLSAGTATGSVYGKRPADPEAFYFLPEIHNIRADGTMDVSEALQAAINQVKTEKNFGILFIPEGKYRISRTIYVPPAIRLIGYGENRPEIILGRDSPGYQQEVADDRGRANYMIWFTGNMPSDEVPPRDAGAGTFYSALVNIDLRIEDGNPHAVALRTNFAQHSMINHSVIHIGQGKAGVFDVGNEMENVRFYGGDYGIYTTTTSPGWPMMMVDTRFEGQRKAAILTNNAGLTIVGMHVVNVPVAVEIEQNRFDRLYLENCLFENISRAGIIISRTDTDMNQVNLVNIDCINVPVLAEYRLTGSKEQPGHGMYRVREFISGAVMKDMVAPPQHETAADIVPLRQSPQPPGRVIPPLPPMDTWVNIRELGAIGDGETDDTRAFMDAIRNHRNIYIPQGWYRFTETVKMEPGTNLIGLHPFGTQFLLNESEPAFSGFGSPKPLLESSAGGDDVINGIGLNTGAYNYRSVAIKWLAGEGSLFNDIKIVGGHGTMRRPGEQAVRQQQQSAVSSPSSPVTERGKDLAWDRQYWSIWITNNGGGTFKNIWTASTYAGSGLYVSNTSTPGRIFAISLEHHMRNEARFENVSNWNIYAFQLEEESREGRDCQMVELSNCSNIMFANLYIFRVIRVNTPQPYGVRLWNSRDIEFRNIHNFAQVPYVVTYPVYDANRGLKVLPWQLARLTITGSEEGKNHLTGNIGVIERIASGFEFPQGITSDSRGNVYFCEHRLGRIYRWSAETGTVSMIADYHWRPFTLATDSHDNLLVVFRYEPQPGYLINGRQESLQRLQDDNNGYSSWGNSGWEARAYSIDPANPDETFSPLELKPAAEITGWSTAFWPSGRWRHQIGWGYDFDDAVVWMPTDAYLAPDGATVIPRTYDLGRSLGLSPATTGRPFYVADETLKRVVRLEVGGEGTLSGLSHFSSRGEFSTAVDKNGDVWVADGYIWVYDKDGKEIDRIELEERPITIAFGGRDHNTLFVTTRTSLYSIRVR